MNVLFSSVHIAKIIKALLYPKKFLTGYVDYIGRYFLGAKKVAWSNGLMVGNG
jgi:hypothetical protein